MASLTFSYEYDPYPDESFGKLSVSVDAGGFVGRGSMWVQWQDLKELAHQLMAFPIAAVSFRRGFDKLRGNDLRIALEIAPENSRGDLMVKVVVADYLAPDRRLAASFTTNYPQVERFSRSIVGMLDRKAGEAVLDGFIASP